MTPKIRELMEQFKGAPEKSKKRYIALGVIAVIVIGAVIAQVVRSA